MRCLFVAMIYIFKLHLGKDFWHDFYQWLERSTALTMEKSNSQGVFRKKKMVVKLDLLDLRWQKGGSFGHKSAVVYL